MNREQATEIACRHAAESGRAYYDEGFTPHPWVVNAIIEAANHPTVHGRGAFSAVPEEQLEDPDIVWDRFWREILTNPDGSIDLKQLKLEMLDFYRMISNISEVYGHVTGGMISKPLTWPSVVTSVADDHVNELVEERVKEELEGRGFLLDTREFATGGVHAGGVYLVGEGGPALEILGEVQR